MNARTSTIRFLMLSATLLFAPASGVLWSQSQPKSPTIDFRPEKPKSNPSVSRTRRHPFLPACKGIAEVADRVRRVSSIVGQDHWTERADFPEVIDELTVNYNANLIALGRCELQAFSRGDYKVAYWMSSETEFLSRARGEFYKTFYGRELDYNKNLNAEADDLVKQYNSLVGKYNGLVKYALAYATASLDYESFLESDIRQLEGRSNLSRPVFIQQWAPPQPVEPVAPLTCSGSSINYGYGITTTSFNCH